MDLRPIQTVIPAYARVAGYYMLVKPIPQVAVKRPVPHDKTCR
jgi:hypothetical protein